MKGNMDKINFFNRDLSWLSFNHRVLQEAKDKSVPLHEKIKFMAIFSSNLDEFFRVRVAALRYLLTLKKKSREKLNIDPASLLKEIQKRVDKQQRELGDIFRNNIIPELKENNIVLTDENSLNKKQTSFASDYFRYEVLPFLRPCILIRNKVTIFLQNKVLYLAVRLHSKREKSDQSLKARRSTYAVVEIPTINLPRFIELPSSNNQHSLIFLDDIIRLHLDELFPGFIVRDVYEIKLTRDAEIYIDDEFIGDLLEKIKKGIARRKTGKPSRFLYDERMSKDFLHFLRESLMLQKEDLVPGGKYHNFSDFISFPRIGPISLQDKKLPALQISALESTKNYWSALLERDHILYFPYHKYDYVIKFLKNAADDPLVSDINITLYRSAADSLIIQNLISAANNGKTVTVFVEIKARFDEESNILWVQKLEDVGIKVLYSVPGLKVHSKICLVKRKEGKTYKKYAYLATGNFNEKTAKLYSDFGLFTTNSRITGEVDQVFQYLKTKKKGYIFKYLLVAPFVMRTKFYELIDNEIANAKNGEAAFIDLKMNSLEDKNIIEKLYQASQAGVKIRIVVRGICCLIPGIINMSENIEIRTIIDRFLEHTRIFIFHNNGREKFYLASADWMRRNLSRRIEVAFPLYDVSAKKTIRSIFEIQWNENQKAREIDRFQKNDYVKTESKSKVRSQIASYEFLKNNS
jgi:polyphosphate kinase